MGQPYAHEYRTAPGSRCGTMQCGGCGKQITDGPFRAYKKSGGHDWRYVTHHRECCADDPAWAKKDRQQRTHETTVAEIEASVAALFARFPTDYHSTILDAVEEHAQ